MGRINSENKVVIRYGEWPADASTDNPALQLTTSSHFPLHKSNNFLQVCLVLFAEKMHFLSYSF